MIFGRNPVLVGALVRSTLVLVTAFGLHLTTDQMAAIILVTETLLAFWTNSATVPTVKVDEHVDAKVNAALNAPGPNPMTLPVVLVALALAGGLSACALAPKPNPTPADDAQRAAVMLAQVQNANDFVHIARGAQKLAIALGTTMPPQTAIDIQTAFKAFATVADAAYAVAQDTSQPFATRSEALASIIAHGGELLTALDVPGAAGLSDMVDALRTSKARIEHPVLVAAPTVP